MVLYAQRAEARWPRAKHEDFAAGEALGRAVGAKVLVYAQSDRVGLADSGTPPIGPGYWKSNGGPSARGNYRARPFFLASDEVFRPAQPPAYGSPAYLVALGEVRQISDTRTADQLAIALYWNLNQSPGDGIPCSAASFLSLGALLRIRRDDGGTGGRVS